ncbi:MAG: TRAP transporter small permease [Betaproteobacteria bacterium]|nr:TRAP transporter small permease [Betaproteobacteria bacterium]
MSPQRTPEDWIAVIGMALLCLITFGNVLVRYFTDQSFAWTEEISVFLLVVMTLAGAAAAAARDNHVRIEYFLERGSAARRRFLAVSGGLVTTLFFLLLAGLTGDMVWDDFRYDETSSGLGLPRWWYTVWVPVLSLVIAFRAAIVFRRIVNRR